jgi:GTP cyclohydrolase I
LKKYEEITKRIKDADARYWAGDNISQYILPSEKDQLIDEATEKFEGVLDALMIDRHNDPNSQGTARRLAKMYVFTSSPASRRCCIHWYYC